MSMDFKELVLNAVLEDKRRALYPPQHIGTEVTEYIADHYGRKCNRVAELQSVSPAFKRAKIKEYKDEAIKEAKAAEAIKVNVFDGVQTNHGLGAAFDISAARAVSPAAEGVAETRAYPTWKQMVSPIKL